jgi:hypothetical protein
VTTKHSSVKNAPVGGVGPSGTNWKFVERRLSAKVLQEPSTRKSHAKNGGGIGGNGTIQYENLMLQDLLDKAPGTQGSASGAFKKNFSVISIDHHPTSAGAHPAGAPPS